MSDFLPEALPSLLGVKCNLIPFCKGMIKKKNLFIPYHRTDIFLNSVQ